MGNQCTSCLKRCRERTKHLKTSDSDDEDGVRVVRLYPFLHSILIELQVPEDSKLQSDPPPWWMILLIYFIPVLVFLLVGIIVYTQKDLLPAPAPYQTPSTLFSEFRARDLANQLLFTVGPRPASDRKSVV